MKPGVLLVDDDPVEADSGEAALREFLSRDFACVLLDVAMPGLDGFETAAEIRKRDGDRRTPIIFVSAHPDRREAGGVGEDDYYLLKPLSPYLVRAMVAERLQEFRLARP